MLADDHRIGTRYGRFQSCKTPPHAPEKTRRRHPPPLSAIHAEALWRPLPPVAYDDDGYPFESRNVSESTTHDDILSYFRNAALALLADRPDAMVQQNLLILFEEGNPTAAVEPDITVALGVGRHHRNSYKLWVEGQPPDLVVEGLSEKTWRRDVDVKPALYRDLGVCEFWQVDPIGRLAERGRLPADRASGRLPERRAQRRNLLRPH